MTYIYGHAWITGDGQVRLTISTTDLASASVNSYKGKVSDCYFTDVSVTGSFEMLEQWVSTLQTELAEARQKAISAE